jgi:hypothetical protein
VNVLSPELETIGLHLRHAYAGRLRRKRIVRVTAATAGLAAVLAVGAAAATGDLQLDPAKWFVTASGSVDNGKAEFIRAKSLQDGSSSTFMVEHDAGMDRYQAFLLHERVKDAAGTQPEPGAVCTHEQLTRAEQSALDALRSGSSPETAVSAEQCRGLAYAVEIAQGVFAGNEPAANLMPGVK